MSSTDVVDKLKELAVNFNLANAIKCDVKFVLFTSDSAKGESVTEGSIKKTKIQTDLPTLIFIHGWNSNTKTNWYRYFREEYFKKGQYNIICVDWTTPGSLEYIMSAANVRTVGGFVADFIVAAKFDLQNVHIIASLLGSHVAAWTGKSVIDATGKKIKRITAFDPAAPQFEHDNVPEANRLNKTDASFVDVIHTDSGYYGFLAAIGTVDFYPNGGGLQPGCSFDETGHHHSHEMCYNFFLESINTTNVKAAKANNWFDYLEGKYDPAESIVFGENIPLTASGVFYFKTNPDKPYLIPEE